MYIPNRMCIVCKKRLPKSQLLRIVKVNSMDNVAIDIDKRMQCRGIYICNDDGCIKKLQKKKILETKYGLDTEKLEGIYNQLNDFGGK